MTENKIGDGGLAFASRTIPDPNDPNKVVLAGGLTKREWFAGMAMGPILESLSAEVGGQATYKQLFKMTAEASRDLADAMLAALKGGA